LFIVEVENLRSAAILPRSGKVRSLADLHLSPAAPLGRRTREAVLGILD
jgi:hypothetical protein